MQITEAFERRTIDYVTREDDGITFVCTDGHSISLHIVDGEIQMKGQSVKLVLPGMGVFEQHWV